MHIELDGDIKTADAPHLHREYERARVFQERPSPHIALQERLLVHMLLLPQHIECRVVTPKMAGHGVLLIKLSPDDDMKRIGAFNLRYIDGTSFDRVEELSVC